MKELELVKQASADYVDFDVFDEGEIYYIIDAAKNRSAIVVCLQVKQDKAIFKIIDYLTGDWFFISDHDLFIIDSNNPSNAAYLHIFPVCFNFQINPLTMKLMIAAEVQLHIS